MSYRDDRAALRQRNDALEEQLAEARAELAKVRGEKDKDEPKALATQTGGERKGNGTLTLSLVSLVVVAIVVSELFTVPAAVVPTALLLVVIVMVAQVTHIAAPNEVLVISSSGRRRLVRGRALRLPLIETVQRLDLRPQLVHVGVTKAYARGGTPLDVEAVGAVRIGGDPPALQTASERFLDQDPAQIAQVARETIEGVLREQVAAVKPEVVAADARGFSEKLREAAAADLELLGLTLASLRVLRVSDDSGYIEGLAAAGGER